MIIYRARPRALKITVDFWSQFCIRVLFRRDPAPRIRFISFLAAFASHFFSAFSSSCCASLLPSFSSQVRTTDISSSSSSSSSLLSSSSSTQKCSYLVALIISFVVKFFQIIADWYIDRLKSHSKVIGPPISQGTISGFAMKYPMIRAAGCNAQCALAC